MSVDDKKREKKIRILESAYKLFVARSIQTTAIDDVVKMAGVAKGTFYLYFKDKYDLLDQIIVHKSADAFKEAFIKLKEKTNEVSMTFADKMIYIISCIIDNMEQNKEMLILINKNLSMSMKSLLMVEDEELLTGLDSIMKEYIDAGHSYEETRQTLFIIAELVITVCSESILHDYPSSIKEMKPVLLTTVRKII